MDINTAVEAKVESKKAWTNPELVAYGSIEDITAVGKKFGVSDGAIFVPTGDGLQTVS